MVDPAVRVRLWRRGRASRFAAQARGAGEAFRTNPVGTGSYVVASFAPNDSVQYAANPNYREPSKPFFARVNLKGGSDAASAARSVLQTRDFDFAWSLLVGPELLD